jgi:membrane protease YdiL (CAAX protease family)
LFSRLLSAVVASESVLLFGAILLGRLTGSPPFARFRAEPAALAWGVAATLPLLVLLGWCLRTRYEPITRLVRVVQERVGPYLAGGSTGGLVAISLMAGIGEEALFRGVIQTALAGRLPVWSAIAITAVLFGVVHWATAIYALLAGLIGAYLGLLYHLTDNLLAPIVTHALYDLAALSALARMKPAPRAG